MGANSWFGVDAENNGAVTMAMKRGETMLNEQQNKLFETFKEFFGSWKKDIVSVVPEDDSSIIVALTFSVKRFGQTKSGDYFMETL